MSVCSVNILCSTSLCCNNMNAFNFAIKDAVARELMALCAENKIKPAPPLPLPSKL